MKRIGRGALVAVLFLGLPSSAAGQSDPGEEVRFRLRTAVELVVVPVTVKDSAGNLVTDLGREEFRLYENGVEQPIRYFSVDPFPLSAVILLDRGLDRSAQASTHRTLEVLANAFGPEDEFALYTFDSYPRPVLPFTSEPAELRAALQALPWDDAPPAPGLGSGPLEAGPRINQLPVGPRVPSTLPSTTGSVKAIHDALYAAGLALQDRERGRRRLVLILSDGLNSRLNVHSFEETRALLLEADVSVYAIGVGNARFALGTTVLRDYARATGGDAYAPLEEDALARSYLRASEQARHQYTLAYAAQPPRAGREFRRIEVRVERRGVTWLAREGYFAGVSLE